MLIIVIVFVAVIFTLIYPSFSSIQGREGNNKDYSLALNYYTQATYIAPTIGIDVEHIMYI